MFFCLLKFQRVYQHTETQSKLWALYFSACVIGFIAWFLVRYLAAGFYTVNQNERAVKTSFGRAERVGDAMTAQDPIAAPLNAEEKERYNYPQVRVIPPGGPYFKWPWEKVYKVSVATQTMNMAHDPENPEANYQGTILEAVTKDQLNTGLKGQIRWHVSERNLYAYLFGVKHPITHVMGYFVSVLRERIANFEAPAGAKTGDPSALHNLAGHGRHRHFHQRPPQKSQRHQRSHGHANALGSAARYGIALDASLITGIDPPPEVESALAAINTAYNQVSSDISLAQAARRPENRAIQARRGNRDAQGAGRSAAALSRWPSS